MTIKKKKIMNSPSNSSGMNNIYEKKAVRRNLIHAGLSAMVICLMSVGLDAKPKYRTCYDNK